MDVTPQLIEQIDFSEKFRGYDPDQVDEFLERVGATIVELNNRLAAAEARAEEAAASAAAASAVQASDQAASAPLTAAPAMSDEEEAAAATSTLMLAKRTADAAIADARSEATKHLTEAHERAEREIADAQAESSRLIADATAHSDELAARAVADAEAEHGRQRDLIMVEITELESRRAGLLDGVTALERRSADHRAALEHMISMLRGVLDDPDALVEPDAGPSGTSPVVEATASEAAAPEAPAADPAAPEPMTVPFADVAPPASAEMPPDAPPAAAPQEGYVDEPTMAHPYVVTPDEAPVPEAAPHDVAPQEFVSQEVAVGDVVEEVDPQGVGDIGDVAAAVVDVAPEGAEGSETWGPGSWSEVAATVDAPPVPDAEPPVGSDAEAATEVPAPPPVFERPPSVFDSAPQAPVAEQPELSPELSPDPSPTRDRYLKDLDDAVNAEDATSDEAMAAFFEGDEKPAPRRFGRRR